MQKYAMVFVASFIALLLWVPNSFAIGLGAFVDTSAGSGEAEWQSDYNSWDVDSNAVAVGFVLDTAPTDEKTFNYRLNVGFARHELEDDDGITMKSNGIYAESIFGFAFIKRTDFRWWAGPLVRVGYYSGDTGTSRSGSNTVKTDVDYAEFALGGVTGLNFRVGQAILAPSVGLRISGLAGDGTITTNDGFGSYSLDEDFEGHTTSVFANFSVLF